MGLRTSKEIGSSSTHPDGSVEAVVAPSIPILSSRIEAGPTRAVSPTEFDDDADDGSNSSDHRPSEEDITREADLREATRRYEETENAARNAARVIRLLMDRQKGKRRDQIPAEAPESASPSSIGLEDRTSSLLARSNTLRDLEINVDRYSPDEQNAILADLEKGEQERAERDRILSLEFERRKKEIHELHDLSFAYNDEIFNYTFSKRRQNKIVSSVDAFFANTIWSKAPGDLVGKEYTPALPNQLTQYYLVYSSDPGEQLYTINLKTFMLNYIYEDMISDKKISSTDGILTDDELNQIYNNFTEQHVKQIERKMKKFGMHRYGIITEEQKNKLLPPFLISNANAIFASMTWLSVLSMHPITAMFGNLVAITGLVYKAHPKLATLFYQQNQQGRTPDENERKVLARDTHVLTGQALITSLTSTMLMDQDFHNLCGWVGGPVSTIASLWFVAVPWYVHLIAAATFGLILAGILTSIAYLSQKEGNEYTAKQLAKVAAIGFVAGAMMYPAFLLSAMVPMDYRSYVSSGFQYLINLGMMAGLSVNIGDRLTANQWVTGKTGYGTLTYKYGTLNKAGSSQSGLVAGAHSEGSLPNLGQPANSR